MIGSDPMEGFNQVDNQTDLYKMLGLLFNKDNIELKTEIRSPPALASLSTLAKVLRDIKFVQSAEVLEFYIKTVNEYYVSFNRQGREEFVEAFKMASFQLGREKSFGSILTSNLKDTTG